MKQTKSEPVYVCSVFVIYVQRIWKEKDKGNSFNVIKVSILRRRIQTRKLKFLEVRNETITLD